MNTAFCSGVNRILMLFIILGLLFITLVNKTENIKESKAIDFITPELKAICAAESTGDWNAEPQQYEKSGKVLKGKFNPHDIGQCQINELLWGEKALLLGYNIYTSKGNIAMANWIYTRYSNNPWYLSRALWDK